ncbi:MAG: FecR domain-containing protein [Chitinophagaceae bacterium]|nr:FecR domain-containing protein [Chitinophagaceae bacterium]
MSADRIDYLIRQYAANKATGAETEELFEWLRTNSGDEALQDQLQLMAATAEPDTRYDPGAWEPFIQQVLQTRPMVARTVSLKWWKYAAAAAIVLIAGSLVFLLKNKKEQTTGMAVIDKPAMPVPAVPPGKNGAVLTLADGRQVLLDSAGAGLLATQGHTAVLIRNGKLVYDVTSKSKEAFVNTMTTPKGRTYQLVLPDGSLVWLNAASSITYPTEFTGTERTVSITGEAYFEIAANRSKPFRVKANDMNVDVLGTSFNINSYPDERDIKTTLLEGAVKISKNGKTELLRPGQQAIIAGENLEVMNHIEIDQVMAWKKGLFNFDRLSLPSILNQLARWYDVDIRYEGAIPEGRFRGKVNRDMSLDLVLEVLKDVGVKFRMEGRTLVVTN